MFILTEWDSRLAVDIKELKLLGDFDHPNIVRFVSAMSVSGVLEASLIAGFPVARC